MPSPDRFLLVLVVSALSACADGSALTSQFQQQPVPGDGGGGSGGDGGAPSATSSSSGSGGAGGAGGAGGEGGAGGGGGSEPACDYEAPSPCTGAELLTQVRGDTGSDVTTTRGNTSRWFKIYVEEGSDLPELMSYTATLVSPAGMNFDLYIYTGDSASPNCLAQGEKGQGAPETITTSWDDNFGSEDGTWLNVEVRYESGTACGDDATWSLSFAGNTVP